MSEDIETRLRAEIDRQRAEADAALALLRRLVLAWDRTLADPSDAWHVAVDGITQDARKLLEGKG